NTDLTAYLDAQPDDPIGEGYYLRGRSYHFFPEAMQKTIEDFSKDIERDPRSGNLILNECVYI
ncbi:unnamed protein product, partial [marine sediment metagenome]